MRNPKGCWLECAAAALALFCAVGLNANTFSVYIPYFTKLFALTPNQTSVIMTVRSFFSLCAVYLAKAYYEKLDIRVGYTLAMLFGSLAMYVYSSATGHGGLCVAGAINGICFGLGGMYPVAILIHRWFPKHESLAMGICAGSSGLAITCGTPTITFLIEKFSLTTAMYCQIGFMLVATVICFLMLRNYPDSIPHFTYRPKSKRHPFRLSWMFFAVMAIGVMNGSFNFLTTHYTTEGFDPYQVATIMSVIGGFLLGAKFLLGELFDLLGGYRTNWIFLPIAILSCVMFSLGGLAGYGPAILGACLFGIGDSVATVGVAVYAKDLSRPEDFAATQQQFQIAGQLGGLTCTLIPGVIATATGNYRGFYLLIIGLMIFATIVVQRAYRKKQRW